MAAVVLAVILLVAQAYCDLSLPNYTSKIVDVGIGQKGIEHPALQEMSAQTYQDLQLFISPGDLNEFANSYDQSGAVYDMNAYGKAHIDELDRIESLPMVIISQMSASGTYTLDQMRQAVAAGLYTQEQISATEKQVTDAFGDMSDSLIKQRAIIFAQGEYESLGIDVNQIQMNYLFFIGWQMLAVTLISVVASIIVGLIAARTAAKIARSLRDGVFKKVISFSHKEIDQFSTASLITRSTNDIQQLQMVCFMLMRIILYAPILGIGGVIMISTTDLSMGWVIGLAVAIIVVIVIVLFTVAVPKFKIMQKLIDKINLVSREILTGIPVIRAFGREGYEEKRFEGASRDLMKTQLFTNRVMTFMQPTMMLVMNGVSVLIVWTAAHQIDIGAMQVGNMIAFITYSMLIIMSFLMIAIVSMILPRAGVAAERVDEVLDVKSSIVDPVKPVDMAAVEERQGAQAGTVRFDHVSFYYEGADEPVLEDIDFIAEPGKTTAIIGSTGCGKSTLLNLIPRFYDVTAGAVLIDGIDVRDMRLCDLHALLGYVPQKGILFTGTIASNISFGGDDISDGAVREAAEIAQATEFIDSRDDGYEEFISQGGTNISGGQKQRLSIARAIAKRSQILLFDDSFSALDYKTDAKLRQALHASMTNKTVIIVAQRISTVLHADQIIVLEEGQIVGRGTHAELMKNCENYREIAYSQLSAAELEGEN